MGSLLPLARVYLAQGRREESFAAISHIAEAARTASSAYSSAHVSAWRTRFHLALGEVDAAARWANDAGLSLAALPANLADLTLHEMTSMTLARLAIAQGQGRAALPLLEHLLSLAEKAHRTTSSLELLLIQSLAYEAIGQREQALKLFRKRSSALNRKDICACFLTKEHQCMPVLDRKGMIRHDGGVVAAPGMYLMGAVFLRRRKSTLIDGAGDDARDLSAHLASSLENRSAR